MKAEHYFATKLRQLESDNLVREPCIYEKIYHKNKKFFFDKNQDNLKLISFADNDYLNLVDCNKIKKVAIKATEKYGVGAGSSRYITGNNIFYQKIEESMRMPISRTLRKFIYPEFFVDTISVSEKFVRKNQKAECVVCLEEKNVLEWPCHIMHITCEECSIKIIATGRIFCPLCRKEI